MRCAVIPLLCLTLAACADRKDEAADDAALIAEDPVIARALHDPLMSDPDLASRNEANAVIGFPDSNALPVLRATRAESQAAREAMRLQLLETGPMPDLPKPPEEDDAAAAKSVKLLGPMSSPAELLAAVGAPARCAQVLKEDFALAAKLPPIADLPPLGMVMQAGGADQPGCRIRIIRYQTAAPREDVLHYHYVRAVRAGLKGVRQGDSIAARTRGDEQLAVHVRAAPHGLTGVTLVYRAT